MNGERVGAFLLLSIVVIAMVIPASVGASTARSVGQQTSVDADRVTMNVNVAENGSAVWEIQYLIRLESENETDAFEDLQADVENNSSAYLDRFSSRIDATVADAEASTGRSMTAGDYEVSTDIRALGNQYGVVSYRFTWEGFAAVDNDALYVGDAIDGMFLDQETTLRISWPDSYSMASVSPEPTEQQDGVALWRGPFEFESGEPTLELNQAAAGPGTTTGDGPTESPGSDEEGSMWPIALGGLVLLAVVGAGLWYFRQSDTATAPAGPSEPDGEVGTPSELLSNEERVIQFLESQGGRAKQQEIVDGLEWTEAKTSQVLSDMQAEETVEKFRIGRENVVKLPDVNDEFG